MTYQVKRDRGLRLLPALLVLLGGALLFLYLTANARAGAEPLLVVGLAVVVIGALLSWLFATAACEITATHVVSRLGPFRCRVALDAILRVIPTSRVFAHGLAWNYALSQDHIHIRYQRGDRPARFGLTVSPVDKVGFLHELLERVPSLKLDRDGTLSHSHTGG